MSPAEASAHAARLERWRSMDDVLTRTGLDWSSSARRRRGWQPPGAASRDPRRASPGVAPAAGLAPDIIRVAFVRIDFATDRGGTQSSGNGKFNLAAADTFDNPVDRPPHNRTFYATHLEALRRYFVAQSYGRVDIQGEVWPRDEDGAYTVSDMADFGPWAFSRSIYGAAVDMFRSFFFAADSQSIVRGDPIPWDSYDRFVLVHAGSDLQDDVRQDSKEDIPTFTIGVGDTDRVFFKSGALDTTGQDCDPLDPDTPCYSIDRALVVPETTNQDGYYGTINGVLAHESGHLLFGLDDLYSIATGYPVVGEWSLMDSGNLVGSRVLLPDNTEIFANGLLPPSVDPWQRYFIGDALNFSEVSLGDTMVLLDSERHPDVRLVPLSSDEYLLLENRYLLPAPLVEIQTDPANHVILGPQPDTLLYDALLPGGGVLVWHIDTSVMPFTSSLRVNPDYGFNTNPRRLGISVIEADGLGDLGDPGSSGILGWPSDPWFKQNNSVLSDTTIPNLIPHIGTRPHVELTFLDEPDSVVRVSARRAWQLAGWPRDADVPPGGPRLLAVDADGDRDLEVCWAGGRGSIFVAGAWQPNPDSSSLFALHPDGTPVNPLSPAFANLDQISMVQRGRPEGRPRPVMAAMPLDDAAGGPGPARGPSWFAVSTYAAGQDTSFAGGRVWLVDTLGEALPGWPALLPSVVTTPPVILGNYPNALLFVGCADGLVYALGLDGKPYAGLAPQGPLQGGVSGRLAVTGTVGGPGILDAWVAAGGSAGEVGAFHFMAGPTPGSRAQAGDAASNWTHSVGPPGFTPDFLWLDFDGASASAGRSTTCAGGGPALVVHHADRLWAFCGQGEAIAGWGRSAGDTLVDGLAAGDLDGDGFPEVITQTVRSKLAYWNVTGAPSPGWPRAGTRESLITTSAPLVLDLDGDGHIDLVGLNGSGVIAAFDGTGGTPPGWPLATGAGATGDVVAADLDRDGTLEIVAPDRFGRLFAYSLPPVTGGALLARPWTMMAGDPGRSSSLPASRSTSAPAPAPGPLVDGSLKAYPNPARRQPVSFAYQLTEPADVEFRILDASGHEVASFQHSGLQADNLVVWDPGRLPAGLYLAQLRFRGRQSERRETMPVGVLR
jgi:M6 family metalloprotease-like protein